MQVGAPVASVAVSVIPAVLLGGSILHRVGYILTISGVFFLLSIGIGMTAWTFGRYAPVTFIINLLLVSVGSGLGFL